MPKLPSLKLPLLTSQGVPSTFSSLNVGQNMPAQIPPQTLPIRLLPNNLLFMNNQPVHQGVTSEIETAPYKPVLTIQGVSSISTHKHTEVDWKQSMESKINLFDSKFNELIDTLRDNQRQLAAERELNQQYSAQNDRMQREIRNISLQMYQSRSTTPMTLDYNDLKRPLADSNPELTKRLKSYGENDFRNNVISIDEARLLFSYFDSNISQQLFGFEILKFSVDSIWETSPILICAICTIASMHYPDIHFSSKQEPLQKYLQKLCSDLLFQGKPRTEREGFNTIVALVLCSFWLSDSQRFTGLALQLAKEFEMNKHTSSKSKDSLPDKDRLKLWYLLYILDGQQSMSFNRQSLINSDDYSLRHSRELLLPSILKPTLKSTHDTVESDLPTQKNGGELISKDKSEARHGELTANFTDFRLVSQVEYNQALNEAFKGSAWDLIAPSAFGIPSKSNLDLDKWMVSWTVLLAPINNGSVWLSKSTLIYYNFAKMHINSSLIRQLQVDTGDSNVMFPNWDNIDSVLEKNKANQVKEVSLEEENDSAEEEDDEEEEFIHNNEIVTQDQALLNMNIAMNAAKTVLNLVLNDADILNNLKYVPVHIHIMLYYAALLLVNRRITNGNNEAPRDSDFFQENIHNLRTVKVLQKKISVNFPTDKHFGDRLIKSLDNVFVERLRRLRNELNEADLDVSVKADLMNEISIMLYSNSPLEMVPDSTDASSQEASPKPEKISAWPGSHHGHP